MFNYKELFYAMLVAVLAMGYNQPITMPVSQSLHQWQDSITVNSDSQFQLKVNQVAFIESKQIKIKFLSVKEDSRCPSDVQCVWPGQVTIVVNVVKNNQNLGDFNLTSRAGDKNSAVENFNGHSIKLVEVAPYPKTTQRTKVSDYIVTLIVSQNMTLDDGRNRL